MKICSKRGQSTGEYAILFAIVLGAVFAVQNFVRHNIAGNLKQFADDYSVNSSTVASDAHTMQRSSMDMQTSQNGVAETHSNTFSTSIAIN